MRRVEADGDWSLFDPKDVPELPDLYGEEFDAAYAEAEAAGLARARRQGARPLRADDAHAGPDRQRLDDLQGRVQPQPATRPRCPGRVVHLSNLCTEILEVTGDDETAVCNLGSINLGRHTRSRRTATFDFDKLRAHGAHRGAVSSTA